MRRAAGLLAIVAALSWAPSPMLAAPPNQLVDPVASPTRGSTLTLFHVSVRYVSSAGNPASAVDAEIGPLSIGLQLTSGSAVDGTWSGSTLLPIGTWQVTFRAWVDQGPQPSVDGPTLVVGLASTPVPSAPNARPVPSEPATAATPAAEPQPTPAPSAPPSPELKPLGSGEPVQGSSPEPVPGGGVGGSGSGPAPSSVPQPAPQGTPGPSARDDAPSGESAPRSPASRGTPGQQPGLLEGTGDEEAPADLLLLLAVIVSVATIALLGTGWMLAARGRDDERSPLASLGAARTDAAIRAAAIREHRTRRRSTLHAAHDPVLAAMGLDDADDDDTPAPARGAARGAGPRPRRDPGD